VDTLLKLCTNCGYTTECGLHITGNPSLYGKEGMPCQGHVKEVNE
jgi:hypothetical protein